MKVNNNLIQALGIDTKNTNKKQAAQPTSGGVQKFDQLIIEKNAAQKPQQSDFLKNLAARISDEVKTGAENHKVQKLQMEISENKYAVSSDEIVKKMLVGLI